MYGKGKMMNIRRIGSLLLCIAIILCLQPVAAAASLVRVRDFGDQGLNVYLEQARNLTMFRALVAADLAEGRSIQSPNVDTVKRIADSMAQSPNENLTDYINYYTNSSSLKQSIRSQAARLDLVLSVLKNKTFPLPAETKIWYADNWHAYRGDNGERMHEGLDITCPMGTPVRSMGKGTVERLGWNTLGGWRVGIRDIDGQYYYYAHLSGYASGLKVGSPVEMGQVIGYSGDSGNGPEGTTGLYEPHLHVGLYEGSSRTAVNPFGVIRWSERNRW